MCFCLLVFFFKYLFALHVNHVMYDFVMLVKTLMQAIFVFVEKCFCLLVPLHILQMFSLLNSKCFLGKK